MQKEALISVFPLNTSIMTALREEDRKVIVPLVSIHLSIVLTSIYLPFALTDDTDFWLFSTVSQSVAALFGFIFAGYAFFSSEATLEDVDDPEAYEILDRLHSKAYIRLTNASIPVGFAIIGGFSTIALTEVQTISFLGSIQRLVLILGTFTFYQAILAVIFSILFVIHIASPNRAQQVVEEILEEEAMTGKDINVGEFMENFINLEYMLRDLYYISGGTNERASAGQITNHLMNEDLLKDIDVKTLREITRYRNLVAHGEIESVDEDAFDALQEVVEEISELHSDVQSQAEA